MSGTYKINIQSESFVRYIWDFSFITIRQLDIASATAIGPYGAPET